MKAFIKLINKLELDEVIKMTDVNARMSIFLQTLGETFKKRVWFVGLQGSYGRGEATETSDIDVVVIVETFMNLKNGGMIDFNLMPEALFVWAKKCIAEKR